MFLFVIQDVLNWDKRSSLFGGPPGNDGLIVKRMSPMSTAKWKMRIHLVLSLKVTLSKLSGKEYIIFRWYDYF